MAIRHRRIPLRAIQPREPHKHACNPQLLINNIVPVWDMNRARPHHLADPRVVVQSTLGRQSALDAIARRAPGHSNGDVAKTVKIRVANGLDGGTGVLLLGWNRGPGFRAHEVERACCVEESVARVCHYGLDEHGQWVAVGDVVDKLHACMDNIGVRVTCGDDLGEGTAVDCVVCAEKIVVGDRLGERGVLD
jgi:hypothetical protein